MLASLTVNVSFLTLDISVDSAIPSFLAKSCCDIPHLAKAALYRFLLIFAPSLPVTYQVTLLYSLMCNLSSVFQKNYCIFASAMLKWVRGDENDIRGENTQLAQGAGHPQKSKKAPIRGHILLFFSLPLCVTANNSVYLVCHRYKICLPEPLGGHGGSSYAHARGLHRAARFVRYAVFIERDGVFV